jgi:hypothetical protein
MEKIDIVDYDRCDKVVQKSLLISLGFSLFLFLISFLLYLNFSYMGARNKEIEDIIFANFKGLLVWINLKILLAYLVIGLVIGLFALLLQLCKKRSIFLFNVFFWFMFWVRGIKLYPQMFTEQLYRKGGVLKYFQVLITDFIPLFAIYAFFVLIIVAISLKKKRVVHSFLILVLTFLVVVKIDVSAVKAGKDSSPLPNVLIFATDSLRPDRISYNGYHRQTPEMDRLFARGVNFLNLKSSLARTLPSWTSVFTSTFPPEHKLRHMFPDKKNLKKNWVTIVDVFNKHGYNTAVVSDFAGDIFPSIDYGFGEVISPELSIRDVLKQLSQEIHYFLLGFLVNPLGRSIFPEMWGLTLNKDPWYVTRYTKKCINKAVKADKPFFLLAFSSNNHFPYVTKYPYYQLYTPKHYYGKHKYGLSSEVLESFLEARVSQDGVAQIANLYDSATKLFDDNLGEMLGFLKKCGIEKNTIVIVMSDHGESLYEENYGLAHGDHLLGSHSNNMVFGIYSPFEDFKGRRVEKTTRDIDIAPTILDLLDLEIPAAFKGHSLLPVMKGAEFPGYPAYMETGVWYSTTTPFIEDKLRLPYPHIIELVNIDMPSGKIVLKKKYEKRVIQAKYKAYQLNEKKYIYMPGESQYKELFYINEKEVNPDDITDTEFLTFKQKMVLMFNGTFYLDEEGFIRENGVDK